MTDQHPITPPPELRQLWAQQAQRMSPRDPVEWMQHVSEKAAQWGAAQELEACCVEVSFWGSKGMAEKLRTARRPNPPSLKEQALKALEDDDIDVYLIRRALEALPND
jgi:hypothetical protein